MACKDCDNSPKVIPVRVGTANVTVLACEMHGAMLIDLLRIGNAVRDKVATEG